MTTTDATAISRMMLAAFPGQIALDPSRLGEALDALAACTQACTACADACLSERTVAELTRCVRLDLDCADICATTARVLTRQTGFDKEIARTMLEACVVACRACGDECARHASAHEHCRICAEVCRSCETACRAVLTSMA